MPKLPKSQRPPYEAIVGMVEYLYQSEYAHFIDNINDDKHVFLHVIKTMRWLADIKRKPEIAAVAKNCIAEIEADIAEEKQRKKAA